MRHFKKLDWSISLSVLFACVLTVIAACVESSGPLGTPSVVEAPTVSSVQITLAQSALAPGQTTQATAVAKSADGRVVAGRVDFSSQNPSIATVSSNGVVTALIAGVAMIQATVAARVATASVTVQSLVPPVAVVAVTLDSTSLTVGHGAKATAVAKDAAGNVITGQAVTWASLSPTIATVSSVGAVMAVAAGSATIKGTISGISGSGSITVVQVAPSPVVTVAVAIDSITLAVGHTARAYATPKDAAGTAIVGQTVTWASLTPSVATVSPSGVVTAVAAGSVAIQASVAGVTGSISIVVVAPPNPDFLASYDFNDGTLGPYNNYGGTDLDVVDDPTFSGRGKVVRIHYAGTNQDRNRYIGYEPAFANAIGLGQTIYSSGEFYLPADVDTNAYIGRKLLYFWNNHAPTGFPEFSSVVTLSGTRLKWWGTVVPQSGAAQITGSGILATLTPGRWYRLETQHTLNSSFSARDGIFRLWLDGQLLFEKTDYSWSDPNWTASPADQKMLYLWVGQQVNFNTGSYDEYRYWDNVAFSSTRIAP